MQDCKCKIFYQRDSLCSPLASDTEEKDSHKTNSSLLCNRVARKTRDSPGLKKVLKKGQWLPYWRRFSIPACFSFLFLLSLRWWQESPLFVKDWENMRSRKQRVWFLHCTGCKLLTLGKVSSYWSSDVGCDVLLQMVYKRFLFNKTLLFVSLFF